MNRTFCVALSLSIIASSLTACATPATKAPISGPQIYGYTLYKPLSSDELNALTNTGFETLAGARVFQRDDGHSGEINVFLDSRNRPSVINKTSRVFTSEGECKSELKTQMSDLQQRIDSHNNTIAQSERDTHTPRGRYVSLSHEACRVHQGDQAEHYRYALSVSKRQEPATSTSGLGKKVDDAYTGAWMTVFMVVLSPFVLIGAAVSKTID